MLCRNHLREWLIGIMLLIMATGCQIDSQGNPRLATAHSQRGAVTSEPEMASPIQVIMSMHKNGQITDQQAAKMLSALLNEQAAEIQPVATPAVQSTVRIEPVTTPSPAPVAPAKPVLPASGLTVYKPQTVITGRMRSMGSDTMDKLMQLWEEGFKQYHPQVRMFHEGKGSSTAPPAISEGRSDFGPMSRKIKDKEIDAFQAKFGYPPTQFPVAIDSLAVYVHPSNPIAKTGLDLQQLDAIFSSTRKRGAAKDITTWGDLGLTGEWANAPIHVYSRNSASGTYGFFKDLVLSKGDYKTTNHELVGSEALVEAVGKDKFGIGYSGIGYKTPAVVTPPLAAEPGGTYYEPKEENANSGDYPLARFLYLTLNLNPKQKPSDLQREFMAFVFSDEGQQLVTRDGFYPLSAKKAKEELAKLGL